MKALVMLVLLGACTTSTAWDLPAEIHPEGGDARWVASVTEAANAWNTVLAGCLDVPFTIADTGYPVVLLPESEWTWPDKGGWQDADQIAVLDRAGFAGGFDAQPTVLHELGHALGLGHLKPSVDIYSVMKPIIGTLHTPSPGDVVRVRALFGCES